MLDGSAGEMTAFEARALAINFSSAEVVRLGHSCTLPVLIWHRPFRKLPFISFVSNSLWISLMKARELLASILRVGRARADYL
jgi:hypothetical protein